MLFVWKRSDTPLRENEVPYLFISKCLLSLVLKSNLSLKSLLLYDFFNMPLVHELYSYDKTPNTSLLSVLANPLIASMLSVELL